MHNNVYRFSDDFIYLYFGYNAEIIVRIKEITGSNWNPSTKEWGIKIKAYNELKVFNLIDEYDFKEKVETKYVVDKEVKFDPIDFAHIEGKISMLDLKFQPRDYQKECIAYGLQHRKIINGDDMGLGKTFSSMVTVEVAREFPCLVITPSSVKYQFAESWVELCNRKSVSVIESGRKAKNNKWDSDVVVINYDILGRLVDNGRRGKNDKVLKDLEFKFPELLSIKWKSLILDEAHFIKTAKAARSKAVAKIIKPIDMRLFLTGTAVSNKPSDAINIFNVLGTFHLIARDWNDYVYRFCNAHNTPFGLDYKGASNMFELNQRMRNTCYIRHEKRDVLTELPPLVKSIMEVDLSNRKAYNRAVEDIYTHMMHKGGLEAIEKLSLAEHLVIINELMKLTIEGKKKAIEQFINDWKEGSDEKLIIFAEHRDIITHLSRKYKCDAIMGGVSSKKKREIVKDWQVNDKQFLFCNMKAAGTGTDGLQNSSSNMLMIEFPWNISDFDQVVSRLERSGQKNSINLYMMVAMESIDQYKLEVLEGKEAIATAVNKGEEVEVSIKSLQKFSKKLFESLVVKK